MSPFVLFRFNCLQYGILDVQSKHLHGVISRTGDSERTKLDDGYYLQKKANNQDRRAGEHEVVNTIYKRKRSYNLTSL